MPDTETESLDQEEEITLEQYNELQASLAKMQYLFSQYIPDINIEDELNWVRETQTRKGILHSIIDQ